MSLQALAGIAFDRRHPPSERHIATVAAARQVVKDRLGVTPSLADDSAAAKVNSALELLKRYIPTELLALYLPFIAITRDHYQSGHTDVDVTATLHAIYAGFVVAAPLMVLLLYITTCVQNARPWTVRSLPYLESGLAIVAFAIWGAAVPAMFDGQQWWLGLLALASSILLPLIESLFPKTLPVEPVRPPKSEPTSGLPVAPDPTEPVKR